MPAVRRARRSTCRRPGAREGYGCRARAHPRRARATPGFTAAEVAELLETVERDWPEWHVFFLTMARTGLRVGECLSIQRDDPNLTHAGLWVRRTWTRGRLGSPRGKRSRAVDLSDQLVQALQTWASVQDAEAAVKVYPTGPLAVPLTRGRAVGRSVAPLARLAASTAPGRAATPRDAPAPPHLRQLDDRGRRAPEVHPGTAGTCLHSGHDGR